MANRIVSIAIVLQSALFGLTAHAQSTVTLRLQGLPDGTAITAELASTFRTEKPVAEATLTGGTCTMTLPVGNEPRYYAFKVKDTDGYISKILTASGETPVIEAIVKKNDGKQGEWYSYTQEKVHGSSTHAEYVLRIDSHRDRLNTAYEALYRIMPMEEIQSSPAFQRLQRLFFDDVKATYKKIASDNKDTWWGPFSMLSLYSYFTPDQKEDLKQFPDSVLNSFYGQLLQNQIIPKGLTGTTVSDFDIVGVDGKRTPLSKAVRGKKVYIVDFWASWCVPCRKEIPNLKAIYERFSGKGLEIVSISIDKNDSAWRKAVTAENLTWPNGIDKQGIKDMFNVNAIPAIFIVDGKTGRILAENIRGEQLANKLAEMLE